MWVGGRVGRRAGGSCRRVGLPAARLQHSGSHLHSSSQHGRSVARRPLQLRRQRGRQSAPRAQNNTDQRALLPGTRAWMAGVTHRDVVVQGVEQPTVVAVHSGQRAAQPVPFVVRVVGQLCTRGAATKGCVRWRSGLGWRGKQLGPNSQRSAFTAAGRDLREQQQVGQKGPERGCAACGPPAHRGGCAAGE